MKSRLNLWRIKKLKIMKGKQWWQKMLFSWEPACKLKTQSTVGRQSWNKSKICTRYVIGWAYIAKLSPLLGGSLSFLAQLGLSLAQISPSLFSYSANHRAPLIISFVICYVNTISIYYSAIIRYLHLEIPQMKCHLSEYQWITGNFSKKSN